MASESVCARKKESERARTFLDLGKLFVRPCGWLLKIIILENRINNKIYFVIEIKIINY